MRPSQLPNIRTAKDTKAAKRAKVAFGYFGLKPEGLIHPLPGSKAPVSTTKKTQKARRADTPKRAPLNLPHAQTKQLQSRSHLQEFQHSPVLSPKG